MDKELKKKCLTKGDIRNAIFQLGLQLKSGANIELINNWEGGGVSLFKNTMSALVSSLHSTTKSPVVLRRSM